MKNPSKLDEFFEKHRQQWKKGSNAVIKTDSRSNSLSPNLIATKNKPDLRTPASRDR
jgi:ribosomal protein S19